MEALNNILCVFFPQIQLTEITRFRVRLSGRCPDCDWPINCSSSRYSFVTYIPHYNHSLWQFCVLFARSVYWQTNRAAFDWNANLSIVCDTPNVDGSPITLASNSVEIADGDISQSRHIPRFLNIFAWS